MPPSQDDLGLTSPNVVDVEQEDKEKTILQTSEGLCLEIKLPP